MPNGDCVVTTIDDKIYHILADSFWNVEEAHENGLKVAIAYPNPGKDVLNIRTGLKDARVEVYDLNGRLIHSQALTEHVTAIDAGDWAKEGYVWKVYISDGGPSTGSGTLVFTLSSAESHTPGSGHYTLPSRRRRQRCGKDNRCICRHVASGIPCCGPSRS